MVSQSDAYKLERPAVAAVAHATHNQNSIQSTRT